MAQTLGLRRLQDLIQVCARHASSSGGAGFFSEAVSLSVKLVHARMAALSTRCSGTLRVQGTCSLSDQPVWLLGIWYGVSNQDTGAASLTPEVRSLCFAAAARGLLACRCW
jgi:hypothetical protein